MGWIVRYPDGQEVDFVDATFAATNEVATELYTEKGGLIIAIIPHHSRCTLISSNFNKSVEVDSDD